jgi:hypothetical protein
MSISMGRSEASGKAWRIVTDIISVIFNGKSTIMESASEPSGKAGRIVTNIINVNFNGKIRDNGINVEVILCMGNGTSGGNVSAISSTLNASSIAGDVNQVVLSGLSPATAYNCSMTAYKLVTGANITQEVTFATEPLPGFRESMENCHRYH